MNTAPFRNPPTVLREMKAFRAKRRHKLSTANPRSADWRNRDKPKSLMPTKPRVAFLSEAIRRDIQTSFRFFKKLDVRHFYLRAPYGDFDPRKFATCEHVPTIKGLWAALDRFQPDAIQGPEPYASRTALRMAFFTHAYARRNNIPYFFPSIENRPVQKRFGPLIGGLMARIMHWYARDARVVLWGNSGARRNFLEAGVPEGKLQEFLRSVWGVDPVIFFPDEKERAKEPTIVFIGRLDEEKGIQDFLDAIPLVAGSVANVRFEMIGRGVLEEDVKRFVVEHGYQNIIRLRGVLKDAALTRAFQRAWVVATPSRTTKRWEEQIGMVNLQAMATKTPVVSTKSGAIPEYVIHKKSGLLVTERDSGALALSLVSLTTNRRLWHTISEGGYARVRSLYLAPGVIRELEQLIISKVL